MMRVPERALGSVGRWRESALLRAGFGTLLVRAASLGLTVLGSILLARTLGPEQLGLYAFALAVVAVVGLPVQMGLPTLVLRETARAGANQAWAPLRGLWHWAGRRILLSCALVIPLTAVGAWAGAGALPAGALAPLLASLALLPLIALAQVRAAALRGLHRPLLGQLPEGVLRPGGLALLLALAWWVGRPLSAEWALGMHVTAAALAFALGALMLWRAAPAALRDASADTTARRDWARAIWPLALLAGTQVVLQNTTILLLGLWSTAVETGLYKIAAAAANLALLGLQVVTLVIAPRFAHLYARGELQRLGRLASVGAGVALAAALLVAVPLLVAGPAILAFLYGEAFRAAYAPLAILLAGQVVNAFYGACVSLLNMCGHERATLWVLAGAALLNVALNALLIPTFGVRGAAFATLVSTVCWNVLLGRAVRRLLGISSTPLGLRGSGAG